MPKPESDVEVTLIVDTQTLVRVLGACAIGLALAHLGVHLASAGLGVQSIENLGLRRFFDLGAEANLPSYFSALLLLLVAALLAFVALGATRRRGRDRWRWWGLVSALLFLSFDEAAMIHDGLVGPALTQWFGRGDGVLHFNWYKLYLPVAMLLALVYVPFLRRLPRPTALRFVLAAAVFVAGAVGFEMVEAYLTSRQLKGINLVRLFEESAEMFGAVLAVRALLLHLAADAVIFRIDFSAKRADATGYGTEHDAAAR